MIGGKAAVGMLPATRALGQASEAVRGLHGAALACCRSRASANGRRTFPRPANGGHWSLRGERGGWRHACAAMQRALDQLRGLGGGEG
eukprot:2478704-Pleurochrysis_carterae.AAC.7